MSFIQVTPDQLLTTAQVVDSASTEINLTSNNALQSVTNLTEAGWQGGGSQAAQTAMQEWKTGADRVQSALSTISGLIKAAEATYTGTDGSVAQSFAG